MSRLKEIKDYLKSQEMTDDEINYIISHSVYLSMAINEYAHKGQFRVNGECYSNHPRNCLFNYQNMVGITKNDPFCIDVDLMYKYSVPFDGVQEVCLLHDILEDTNFTIDELYEIFKEVELDTYFSLYIKKPLLLITHDKSVEYSDYIKICMNNPIPALVKMIDLVDNMNILSLDKLDEYNYNRTKRYLKYANMINSKYHFIENIHKYKLEFNKERDI